MPESNEDLDNMINQTNINLTHKDDIQREQEEEVAP